MGDQVSGSDREGDTDKGTKASWISWSRRAKWTAGYRTRLHFYDPRRTRKPERWLGWLHDRGAAIAVNRLACRCSWPVENVHCAPVSSSWGMKGRSCMKTDSLVIFPRVADDWLEGLPPSENELACMFSLKSLVSD